ncbi:MAG TPA: autotransporter-associated beta strand repeat-containing protein, partial [Luteolibacter sp.]
MGESITANGLTFSTAGYTIAPHATDSTFTLTLGGTTPTINTAGVGASISAILAGSNGMIKTGTDNLTLSGANTYTGSTNIQEGTVHLSSGSLAADTTLNLGNGSNSGKFILSGTAVVNQTVADLTTTGTGTSNAVVGGNATVSTLTVNKASGN